MSARYASQSPADLADLLTAQPLAWIVSGHPQQCQASVLPVQLEADADGTPIRLLGHFGRGNPQLRQLAEDPRATVLVLGPQGYVSPSWFADRSQAPTWNFAWAMFEVRVELQDTPADADRRLHDLVGEMEHGRANAWSVDDMGPRYSRLSQGVVGFEARILSHRSRFKLGQDERDDVFADILLGLQASGQTQLHDWMLRFNRTRPDAAFPAVHPPPSPIDPEIARFIDSVCAEGRRLAAGRDLDWPQRREIAEAARRPWIQGGPRVATREILADTEAGPVRLRLYEPAPAQHDQPALVYLHGGGWALFSLDTHDRLMREYAARSGMPVIGVDYALAPEARYPRALEQVVAIVRWLGEHAPEFGIDPQRIALGGDSAGGNLSFAAALKLRDAGEPARIRALLGNYACFDAGYSDAAKRQYGGPGNMLTADEVDEFWGAYTAHLSERRQAYASPLHATLQGLPAAFLVVAECDILAEQNLQMGGRLMAAGVAVDIRLYPGAPHSFIEAMAVSATANRAIDDAVAWLRQALA